MNHVARPIEGPEKHRLLWHARRANHRRRLGLARATIWEALARSERPYVAFSCGKDSVAMALLVLEEDPTVPLHFLSSEESRELHDMDGVLDWFRARGATVREWRVEVEGETWADHNAVSREARYTPLHEGMDCVFLGLRTEEGPSRSVSLLSQRTEGLPRFVYRYQSGPRMGMLRCCPLALFRLDDVAAVIAAHGAPLLGWYHEWGYSARTTARLTERVERHFTLAHLKRTNPDGATAILRRFPELRSTLTWSH